MERQRGTGDRGIGLCKSAKVKLSSEYGVQITESGHR